jgi:hypothetical protein
LHCRTRRLSAPVFFGSSTSPAKHNWPLAAAAAGLLLYIPVVLVTGTFFTNQGNITRKNEPTRYWRWVALFLSLLLASLVVLFGSYFLSMK